MPASDCTQASAARLQGVIVGLLLLAIGASAGAAEAPGSVSTTHLVGNVLDASGKPAAGAVVGLLANRDVLRKRSRSNLLYVKADAAGRFDLAVPRSLGTAMVVARRAGSSSATSGSIALQAPRQEVRALKLGKV